MDLLASLPIKPPAVLLDLIIDSFYKDSIELLLDGKAVTVILSKSEFRNLLSLSLYILNQFISCNKIPFMIGICGCAASGKSSLSALLSYFFNNIFFINAIAISTDAYHYDESFLIHNKLLSSKGLRHTIDYSSLLNDVCMLAKGNELSIPIYSRITHNPIPSAIEVNSERIIIIEGLLFNSWSELRNCLDFHIYLDTPLSVSYERLIKRKLAYGASLEAIINKFNMVDKVNYNEIQQSIPNSNLILRLNDNSYIIDYFKMLNNNDSLLGNIFHKDHPTSYTISIYDKTALVFILENLTSDHIEIVTDLNIMSTSIILCYYLYSIQNELVNFKILELGAGSGLVSVFLSILSKNCNIFISDFNSSMMLLLYYNILYNLLKENKTSSNSVQIASSISAISDNDFDFIIGLDIFYKCNDSVSLLKTVIHSLNRNHRSIFILSHINRNSMVTSSLIHQLFNSFNNLYEIRLDLMINSKERYRYSSSHLHDFHIYVCEMY